jgi:hypothetical protein
MGEKFKSKTHLLNRFFWFFSSETAREQLFICLISMYRNKKMQWKAAQNDVCASLWLEPMAYPAYVYLSAPQAR